MKRAFLRALHYNINMERKCDERVSNSNSEWRTKMAAMNQSAKIRARAFQGQTNQQIAKALGIRYQTVWRTLNRPFKGIVPQAELIEKGIRTQPEPLIEATEVVEA
jgi:FixJ family two-component response regulator